MGLGARRTAAALHPAAALATSGLSRATPLPSLILAPPTLSLHPAPTPPRPQRDEARKLLPQHVFSITVFPANGELDKVCVLMVPGARDIAAAKSKAADYHELRKLVGGAWE